MAKTKDSNITFQKALRILNIEDYGERIWYSNSYGELFHIEQYFAIAKLLKDHNDTKWFRAWFESIVKYAEDNWERPESVFQHIQTLLIQCL